MWLKIPLSSTLWSEVLKIKENSNKYNFSLTMRRNLLNLYVLVSISKNLRFTVFGLVYYYRVSESKVFFFNLAPRERNIQVRL